MRESIAEARKRARQEMAQRLRQARERAGYRTAAEFASKHEIPQSTYANHESGGRGLTRDVARDYATKLGIDPTWLIFGDDPKPTPSPSGQSLIGKIELGRLPIVGEVQAGLWVEAMEWPVDQWKYADAPMIDRFPGVRRFGLEVSGPSMNELYPDGSVVICVSFDDIRGYPESGNRVVVERRRADGLVEATIKEYKVDDSGPWLWPRSFHPAFQQPIPLTDPRSDEEVRIVALVIASYRPE